jgi:hypothetical protein
MTPKRLNIETSLYLLALVLAIAMRVYHLGEASLNDREASWALQALQIAQPSRSVDSISIGANPGYIMLTGLVFALLGSSNFLARLWPALVGSFLVLFPAFFRRNLGRGTALVLAFGLAVDPGLVVLSRQAGGPMMSLGFGILSLGAWRQRKIALAGILVALAFLSGSSILLGGLGLGLAWLIWTYARKPTSDVGPLEKGQIRNLLLAVSLTLLLVGTLIFRYPQGLFAWVGTLPVFLNGWLESSGIQPARLVLTLLIYEPFAFLFAMIGIVHWVLRLNAGDEPLESPLVFPMLWALISLLLVMVYPGRHPADLAWCLIPLWILAATELTHIIPGEMPHPVSIAQASLLLVLGGLLYNALIATDQFASTPDIPSNQGLRLALVVGILALASLTTLLVGLGWSMRIGRDGLVGGVLAIFLIYNSSVLWGAAQLNQNLPQELWNDTPATNQERLFLSTLADLSNWSTGFPTDLNLVSIVDTPAMRWSLRSFGKARFLPNPPIEESPDVLITWQDQQTPELAATYRGQDFAWRIRPGWTGLLPPNRLAWLIFREAPLQAERIILWARIDLFPGGGPAPKSHPLEIK